MEDDFMDEGADVVAAHSADPHSPVQGQGSARRGPARLARVSHL